MFVGELIFVSFSVLPTLHSLQGAPPSIRYSLYFNSPSFYPHPPTYSTNTRQRHSLFYRGRLLSTARGNSQTVGHLAFLSAHASPSQDRLRYVRNFFFLLFPSTPHGTLQRNTTIFFFPPAFAYVSSQTFLTECHNAADKVTAASIVEGSPL